ncbi:ABC transporter ATP-binding protein [Acetobacterium woodii]|uniref:ABC transport system ATP-binding and permease protein n=1 Tax=Acetobacterium woodii (strain ATCC 29683 / DSM 1030 / JCM 2381 / KCTC 1655 / WB1) TaxID=931626 RepID=H6LDV7_ACEWD|nr:ABC transporter ATP-binding protein [Acetobacterium woodii]AFA48000.1 ABC transport system ATP-binding and permease protein [Acetobacterium woodii DSM 1030]
MKKQRKKNQSKNKKEFDPVDLTEMEDIPKNSKASAKRLMALLCQQKSALLIILLAAVISNGLFALTPIFMGQALDRLIQAISANGIGGNFETLAKIVLSPLLLLAIAYLFGAIFSFLQEYTMASVGEKLALSLREQISKKITKLPLHYYDANETGEILSRTTNDPDKIAEVLKTGALQFVNAICNIIFSIVIMLTQSPFMTVLIISTMSLSVFATKWISAKTLAIFYENQMVLGELNGKIEEYYTGNLIIKSFNQQDKVIQTERELSERQYQANKKSQFVIFAIYPAIRFLTQLSFVATAIVGGFFAIKGTITIGTVQAFLQYVNQISDPITQSSYFVNSLQAALASAERVFEFLDEAETVPDTTTPKQIAAPDGAVAFEHVRFGYHPDKILMEDISFTVRPNEMVAIVGPTGAGKTTLVNLLLRFYELDGGKITVDNIDIKDLSKSKLRRMVGMVLQDTWLFKGTIAENIAYGKMDATREDIIQVAKAARCDHFIRTLSAGYDTVISNDEGTISQGQMQLLTIARAMLANPVLMILDEATSSVDTKTELEVQQAMVSSMKGKTSFVIAHRLSTIKSADLILVMKNGTIVEKGTHQELLAADTFYADLYNSQFNNLAL